ncbi:MAG: T9SS type A sorting domain-containing protein [Aquaticitalea sp.]
MKKLYIFLLLILPLFSFSQITTQAMDMTVECDGNGNVADLNAWLSSHGGAVASTACGTVTWIDNFTAPADNCGSTGSATVTFTATNTCETATTTATFTIQDTSAPILNASASSLTVECDGAGNTADLNAWLASNGGAQASDGCSTVNWSNDFSGLDTDCGQTEIVTFVASDNCGNIVTSSATFTIEDTISPTITDLSSDMTVTCDGSGNTSQLNAWLLSNGGAEAFDNCGEVEWNYSFPGLTSDCSGTVSAEALFTVTDACGNEEYTYSTFTIESAASDCPDTPIVLSSQADVDAFTTNYPNCTELNNSLTISGADIVDLTPLSGVTSINDSLFIHDNPNLTNLNGLESLTYLRFGLEINSNALLTNISALSSAIIEDAQGVFVTNNASLLSLDGLQGVQGFVQNLAINNNDSLTNLIGLQNVEASEFFNINGNDSLQNLTGLDNYIGYFLYIQNNLLLQSLNGLNENVQFLDLRLIGNANLNNIDSLNNVSFNFEILEDANLEISDNPNLSLCNVNAICSAINEFYPSAFYLIIENNAPGCSSIAQVSNACNLVPSNDDCIGAIDLTLNETIQAYNELGTQSPQTPSCNDTNRVDVWFTFNSATLNSVDISVDADYSVQLWEGTCTNLTQVANACASNMLDDVAVTPNTDYYLQVWSDGTGRRATGLFEVLVQDATLSVADNNFESFSIYPNPVNDLLNFKSGQNIDELQVYTLLGQNVMSTTPKTTQTQMDLSGLKSGLYILKVRIENETASYKIVKE